MTEHHHDETGNCPDCEAQFMLTGSCEFRVEAYGAPQCGECWWCADTEPWAWAQQQ